MMNKEKIDKYDTLFRSSVDFTLRVGLYQKDDLEGSSDEEIESFCKKHNIRLPEVLWSYSHYFGNKAKIRDSNAAIEAHSFPDFDYAFHQASLRDEWHEGRNLKELLDANNPRVNYDYDYPIDSEGLYTPPIKDLMNIDDIIFIHYDPFRRGFKFVDSSKENPEVFHLTRYQVVSSYFNSFSNRFRDILFMFIASYAGEDFVEMAMIDKKLAPIGPPPIIDYSGGFEFVKEYQSIFKNKNINRSQIMTLRQRFYVLNNLVEKEEDRILSFNEFETKFIQFIKDNL